MTAKRLTDKERARDMATLDLYIPQHTPSREARERLVADHLQAREDVKRLARRLRERQGGACCERARTQCEDCAGDLVLLAEVGQ